MPPHALPNLPPPHFQRYALGISGGADSTFLARAVAADSRVQQCLLVHLNHQLRGEESDADEDFCRQLARQLGLELVVEKRSAIEPLRQDWPANPSARYRAMRHELYRKVIAQHNLDAVLLAHHRDDQAETVLLRLARGSGILALGGMKSILRLRNLVIERPLLHLPAASIRQHLEHISQPWREDSSNQSPHYRRNIARTALQQNPALADQLCELSRAATLANDALDGVSPLPDRVPIQQLAQMPRFIAEHVSRRWLIAHGAPADDVSPAVCLRFIQQATDPTSAIRRHYPGKLLVRRKKGHLELLT